MSTKTQPAPGRRRAPGGSVLGDRRFVFAGLILVVLAALLRIVHLADWPGIEWDENVYRAVGEHVARQGGIYAKSEYVVANPEPYLYHPPLHFLLLGGWFKLFGTSLVADRALAVLASVIMIMAAGMFLRRMIGNWALVAMGLLALDTWMVFSNRVSWIENVMIPIGIIGLWLYHGATRRGRTGLYVLAGAVLGLAVVYKHVGVIFPMAVAIAWLLNSRDNRKHIALFASFAGIAAMYIGIMWLTFGQVFFTQSVVQFRRSTGAQESRGALTSLANFVDPILDQYGIFAMTLLLMALAVLLLIYRTIQMIRRRTLDPVRDYILLYAWGMAALLFFIVLQLRFPHYLMLALVPFICYLAAEVRQVARRAAAGGRVRPLHIAIVVVAIIAVGLNANAFMWRFVLPQNDRALAEIGAWTERHLPADAKVITEESVGATIKQPYCKMWRAATCYGASYIITYTSHTQKLPDDPGLKDLIATGVPVHKATGFKETITVIRLSQPVG